MTTMEILDAYRTIAVIGLSSRPWRPSFSVSSYMQSQGYRIIPVNPFEVEVLGEKAFPALEDVPDAIQIMNVFRRSEHVPSIVRSAMDAGARVLWLQEGVIHEAAAADARSAGLDVVMDRCILKEHMQLFG